MAKLLYIEDNEMNRDMLSRRLSRRGYEIIMAFKHLKGEKDMSQYDKDDLNKDGKVDDLDRKISNTKKSGEYYNQPGFS